MITMILIGAVLGFVVGFVTGVFALVSFVDQRARVAVSSSFVSDAERRAC